ncbi:MAG: cytochrome oxidase [Myxococcales bacterium]|nr:MAG: cytochrome oxidase [Myxococcales bacterium]
MEVLILQVFVSLMLVVSSVVLFAYSVARRDHEHSDRLALLPIQTDDANPVAKAERP